MIPDNDQLKLEIVRRLKERNRKLYLENCGIADVIARCLRIAQYSRTRTAERVLLDLELFEPADLADPTTPSLSMPTIEQPLLSKMAVRRVRRLLAELEDMAHGVYDLIGDHEEVVAGVAQFISFLGASDAYLTVSIPTFWHTRNLGVNGRFLSANRVAAERGATIRRVFIITEKERSDDKELGYIMQYHQQTEEEMPTGVRARSREPSAGGLFSGFIIVGSEEDRTRLLRDGHHYGLLISKGQSMVLSPMYSDDGTVVGVKFRSAPELVESERNYFLKVLGSARPLSEYVGRAAAPSASEA